MISIQVLIIFYFRDKRDKVNPSDYIIENVKGQTVGRIPGTVNGQQFIIQNCEVKIVHKKFKMFFLHLCLHCIINHHNLKAIIIGKEANPRKPTFF